jgi:predicted DNA repair protein MutK
MTGTSLLALLDDIATVLDDVAAMAKFATKKTAGVLGDDLALNAEQVAGVRADRELPVVWAVAKGSGRNKLILVPLALAVSAVAHRAITPILMLGGAYLCFEGFEKIAHKLLHKENEDSDEHAERVRALTDPAVDMVAFEREKVRGAVRTDFILSAEIIVITLGVVADAPFVRQVIVLSIVSVLMTVGVYGLVAGIVKLDDAGLALRKREGRAARAFGGVLLRLAPYLMKFLAVAGTVAMFLVGGGILNHGIPGVERAVKDFAAKSGALGAIVPTLADAVTGLVAGAVLVGLVTVIKKLRRKK